MADDKISISGLDLANPHGLNSSDVYFVIVNDAEFPKKNYRIRASDLVSLLNVISDGDVTGDNKTYSINKLKSTFEELSKKDAPNGYAGLEADGKIKLSQLAKLINDSLNTGSENTWSIDKIKSYITSGVGVYVSSSGTVSLKASVSDDGTGFVYFKSQADNPFAPADGYLLFANSAGDFSWRRKNGTDNYIRTIGGTLTANREYTLQDASYKIAGVDIDNQFSAPQSFKKYIEIDNDITTGLTLSENATNNQTTLTVTNDISMYPQKGVLVVTANSAREYIIYDGLNIANKQFLNCIRGAYGTAALSINKTFPIHLVKFLIPSYSSETVLPVMTVAEGMQNAAVQSALFHYGIGVNRIQDTTSHGGTGQLILQNFLQVQRGGPIDMVYSVSSGNQLYFGTTSTGNLSLVQNGTVRMVVGADILSSVGIKAPSYQVLDADYVTYKVALNSPSTNVLQVGGGYTTVYLPTTIALPAKSGVDVAGDSYTISSGAGTGAGQESIIKFATPTIRTSGDVAQSLAVRMQVGAWPGNTNGGFCCLWLGNATATGANYSLMYSSSALSINHASNIEFRIGAAGPPIFTVGGSTVTFGGRSENYIGITVKAHATQAVDLTRWTNSSNAILGKIDKDGKASFPEVHVRSLKLEVASADSDITLGDNWPFMVFTGSVERTWTLPSVVPANYSKFFFIKNRASANLNIAGTIYFDSAVSSIVLAPGEGLILGASGTYWEVITKLNL